MSVKFSNNFELSQISINFDFIPNFKKFLKNFDFGEIFEKFRFKQSIRKFRFRSKL